MALAIGAASCRSGSTPLPGSTSAATPSPAEAWPDWALEPLYPCVSDEFAIPTREESFNEIVSGLTLIDSQTFDMGCTQNQEPCELDEYPVRSVLLTRDFLIGTVELAAANYQAIMGGVPYDQNVCGENVLLAWHQGAFFLNLLSDELGFQPCYWCDEYSCDLIASPYECDGFRFPTEAEWEAAARCGTDFRYAGTDDLDMMEEMGCTDGYLQPAGTDQANDCGLFGMSCNLPEWVNDRWADQEVGYDPGETVNPLGFPGGMLRGLRGGERWGYGYPSMAGPRISDRGWSWEVGTRHGVRVARTADP